MTNDWFMAKVIPLIGQTKQSRVTEWGQVPASKPLGGSWAPVFLAFSGWYGKF
jgi:hypothetical protein